QALLGLVVFAGGGVQLATQHRRSLGHGTQAQAPGVEEGLRRADDRLGTGAAELVGDLAAGPVERPGHRAHVAQRAGAGRELLRSDAQHQAVTTPSEIVACTPTAPGCNRSGCWPAMSRTRS